MRYDLTIATRFIHQGLNYRFDARRGDEVDWVHDPTNQRLTLTDEQIAELVAEEGARPSASPAAPRIRRYPNPPSISKASQVTNSRPSSADGNMPTI